MSVLKQRCVYTKCHRPYKHKWNGLDCFAFCDEHWPAFYQLMTKPRDTNRFRGSIKELKEEGLRLLADGIRPAKVAELVGVHRETAYRWLNEVGHTPQPRSPLTDEELEQARQMYEDGVSWRQMAKRLHRSATTLKRGLEIEQ